LHTCAELIIGVPLVDLIYVRGHYAWVSHLPDCEGASIEKLLDSKVLRFAVVDEFWA